MQIDAQEAASSLACRAMVLVMNARARERGK